LVELCHSFAKNSVSFPFCLRAVSEELSSLYLCNIQLLGNLLNNYFARVLCEKGKKTNNTLPQLVNKLLPATPHLTIIEHELLAVKQNIKKLSMNQSFENNRQGNVF